ncbi:unnamed protein product, partial [Mesorhabditis belari]|uniref:Uncharacterized protein n=1 Tax=Mesorhabditis belari TaxID=2138241 RepID=A0AAF3FSP2_9BILA
MSLLKSDWPDSSESRQRMLESASSSQFPQYYEATLKEKVIQLLRRIKPALIIFLTPMIFSFLLINGQREFRCAFCVCVMAVYWMTEVMPLAVTAMLPVVLFPFTGVLDCNNTAKEYINDTNFLFIGGLIMAASVEKCDLHERVALSVLRLVGSQPKWIMAGFMIVTALLSMFISNTATTAMMVPIGQSVISQLVESFEAHPNTGSSRLGCRKMATGLVLSICFAANIGGTGTATGTPSNLVMLGQLTNLFPAEDGSLNYISWIFFAVPLMLVCLICCWATLWVFFLRKAPGEDEHVTKMLHERYEQLPRMSYAEKSVFSCFVLLLCLWMFRNPGVVPGFGKYFAKGYYTDATSAIIVSMLLFMLPAEKPELLRIFRPEEVKKGPPRLMDWATMQKSFPWSVVLLLGGGFALAAGVKESGLSQMLGQHMSALKGLDSWALQGLCMAIAMLVTNICSNTVTASIFVPIVATLAQEVEIHPFQLMLPTTLACSFAFVLPVGTPPNAIVFGSGMVKVSDMMFVGFVLSLETLFLTIVYMKTAALVFLPLSDFPAWAALPGSLNETLLI